MGKVHGNWLTGSHSGRACRHESVYTKVNKKTGACYSAKLCNPVSEWTSTQLKQRTSFGQISAALAAFIKAQTAAPSDQFTALLETFKRQGRYSTLRGYMIAKKMAVVKDNANVTITIGSKAWNVKDDGTITEGAASGGSGSTGGGGDVQPIE